MAKDAKEIIPVLPAREAVTAHGWKFQVQWIEGGNTCFQRCKSGAAADRFADGIRKGGLPCIVIDLVDALQLH
jgi:hypothetical protein